MADAGYFRGTSAEQDNRFSDKEKKLMKQMRFGESISKKVEMSKVHLESLKPWISHRISELLGMEDDVLQEFVFNQLEADKFPDGRRIQINLTGFLNGKNARIFVEELWNLLLQAQDSSSGVPPSLVTAKKEELRIKTEEQERLNETLKRTMSRFQDKLRNESPPHVKPGRSPSPSSRGPRQDSRSNETTERPQSDSRGKDQAQGRRQYRSRKSASPSPPAKDRSRSRERDNRGRRDNAQRSDRNTERRVRSRRSRSRSPRHRRRSPSPRQPQPRREREYGLTVPDRSDRKPKADGSDRTKRPRHSTRSPSPISRPTKELSDEVEPEELVPTSESQIQTTEPDNSPTADAESSDSGSPRGRKRTSVSSHEGSPDPDSSKKNKKKSKKHKKHKKHKKSKKDDEEEKASACSAPPLDDLEKALREKALESMKRAIENSVQSN